MNAKGMVSTIIALLANLGLAGQAHGEILEGGAFWNMGANQLAIQRFRINFWTTSSHWTDFLVIDILSVHRPCFYPEYDPSYETCYTWLGDRSAWPPLNAEILEDYYVSPPPGPGLCGKAIHGVSFRAGGWSHIDTPEGSRPCTF